MNAAIYARKSTDQNLPDAEKSVTRQVEHATAYATWKGWTVVSLPLNPSRCLEELPPFVKGLGHGSEQHPAWTNVFRVECQTQGARRPR